MTPKSVIIFILSSLYVIYFSFISWRMSAAEALRHPWLSDTALHRSLHTKVEITHLLLKANYI